MFEVGEIPQDKARIPARVERILITRFSGDPVWGPQASQSLVTALRDRLDRKSVQSYSDLTDPDIPPRKPGAGPRDEEEAIVRGKAADADAVLFGSVAVYPVKAENAPPDALPVRVSVIWKAVLMDVATRQVYVSMSLSETRVLEAAGPSGRPELDKLDRKPNRQGPPSTGEATAAMITELTNTFLAAYDGPPAPGANPVTFKRDAVPDGEPGPASPDAVGNARTPLLIKELKGFAAFFAMFGYEQVKTAAVVIDKIGDYLDVDEPNPRVAERRLSGTGHVFGLEAEYFLGDGNVDLAFDTYQRALLLRPDDPAVLYNMGVIAEYRNKPASADRYYAAALALDPKNSKYLKARSRVFALVRTGPAPLTDE